MAANGTPKSKTVGPNARYEYRVWGQYPKARKALRKMADSQTREVYDDCYLLVDDMAFNAKVRDNTLKIKQLVAEHKGFEQWTSERHLSAKSTPTPFDDIYRALDLDRARRKKRFDLRDALEQLDPELGVRAVFVAKHRVRFAIGDLRAEATDIEIVEAGELLHTLCIQGNDLPDLVKLRKRLGLKGEPNTPMHQVIDLGVNA